MHKCTVGVKERNDASPEEDTHGYSNGFYSRFTLFLVSCIFSATTRNGKRKKVTADNAVLITIVVGFNIFDTGSPTNIINVKRRRFSVTTDLNRKCQYYITTECRCTLLLAI